MSLKNSSDTRDLRVVEQCLNHYATARPYHELCFILFQLAHFLANILSCESLWITQNAVSVETQRHSGMKVVRSDVITLDAMKWTAVCFTVRFATPSVVRSYLS